MKKFIEFFTGNRPEKDNLISFFHQTIKEKDVCARYAKDAEAMGDQTLVEFFREIEAQDRLRASRAEEILRMRIQ